MGVTSYAKPVGSGIFSPNPVGLFQKSPCTCSIPPCFEKNAIAVVVTYFAESVMGCRKEESSKEEMPTAGFMAGLVYDGVQSVSLSHSGASEAIMQSWRILHRIPISKCRGKDVLTPCFHYCGVEQLVSSRVS